MAIEEHQVKHEHTYYTIESAVNYTANHTPYLMHPGIVQIGQSDADVSGMKSFIDGLGYDGDAYVDSLQRATAETQLTMAAGQLCYESYGEARSRARDAAIYTGHIRDSKHYSIAEHFSASFLIYGVSRSLTHELVRHRVGVSPSQVSQRYVDKPRFVMRSEYQNSPELQDIFRNRIDRVTCDYYKELEFLERQAGVLAIGKETMNLLQGVLEIPPDYYCEEATPDMSKTDLRKALRQVARAQLPNETEAPIIITINLRSARHLLSLRARNGTDTEIRVMAIMLGALLRKIAPNWFSDISVNTDFTLKCLE